MRWTLNPKATLGKTLRPPSARAQGMSHFGPIVVVWGEDAAVQRSGNLSSSG